MPALTVSVQPTPELQQQLQKLVENLVEQGHSQIEAHAEEMYLGLITWLMSAGLLKTSGTPQMVLEWYKDFLLTLMPEE